MTHRIAPALYVLLMVSVIVAVNVLFFRHWGRLLANIGIVLVFVAFYLRFFRST